MRRRLVSAVVALVVGALSGCGGGTDPLPVDGTMHAEIIGSSDPWDAEKKLTATMSSGGTLVITGVESSSIEITLTIYDAAVGSFSANGTVRFDGDAETIPQVEATYGDARTFSYTSSRLGGTVLVNITELSATKAVGTFEFFAVPQVADPQGTTLYRVRNGTFNVRIK